MSNFMNRPIDSVTQIQPDVYEVKAEGMVVHTDGKRVEYLSTGKVHGFSGLKFETAFDRQHKEANENGN